MDNAGIVRGFSKKDRIRSYCAVIFCENGNTPLYVVRIFDKIKDDPDFRCKNLERKNMGRYLNKIDIIKVIEQGYEKMYKIRDDIYDKLPRESIIKSRKQTQYVQNLIDEAMNGIEDEEVKPEEVLIDY